MIIIHIIRQKNHGGVKDQTGFLERAGHVRLNSL